MSADQFFEWLPWLAIFATAAGGVITAGGTAVGAVIAAILGARKSQVELLRQEVERLSTALHNRRTEIEGLWAKEAETQKQMTLLQAKNASLEYQLSQLQAENKKLGQDVALLTAYRDQLIAALNDAHIPVPALKRPATGPLGPAAVAGLAP